MCLLDNSLYFIVGIKAVLEGRGFKPKTFGNIWNFYPYKTQKMDLALDGMAD